ncbi:head-tail joining protein [Paraburkholderia caballeronis]|uniref:Uncharacterized protein n=1 Tax=Paraburkholderia caballeronis TaxID=416943 RepID=A0A1H7TYC4_9BURK|nr:hypothetical protein [Paraburkholderia caballeronis]PXW23405.1 hypothetical protein C7403_110143 [Paraburkholderia caballeronis]PXW98398.1 hypothetical protein C7407_110143 [Paraburkholderia caballeronis]RAJ95129.1 hypothetical protein C7409_110144 [Paraburkholderia caballeronis]SEC55485.1 hypothetical protein SAMN05445871_2417 [Paraburkholderia caballeronis]SEL89872.1 hypothetical protein SAMN05192542_11733 [Paraburkholderia caballeronis]
MIDFDGTLNAAIESTLGDEKTVVYLPRAGGSIPVLAIFTLITDHVLGDDGDAPANIAVATLGLRVSQLPVPPAQSDSVLVGATTYVVKDVDFDGLGWAYLDLGLQ